MKHLRVKPSNNTVMKCTEAEIRIIDLLTQRKPVELDEELSRHLGSCSSCTRLLNECRNSFDTLLSGRKNKPDPEFYDRLLFRMQQNEVNHPEKEIPVKRIIRLSPMLAAVAASVILGIWIGGQLFTAVSSGALSGNQLEVANRAAQLQAFASDVNLEDESTLALESYLTDDLNATGNDTK
ncbi:MAG: DUF3379 domain-containing protein [Lentimicrobium sp.]|nr:DUF3379 domain-containing protein [Lentimicrobium sp.]